MEGWVRQKAITEGHFQPEGQYQKVTFPGVTPLWRQTPPERTWDQTGSDIIPTMNRHIGVKTLPSHDYWQAVQIKGYLAHKESFPQFYICFLFSLLLWSYYSREDIFICKVRGGFDLCPFLYCHPSSPRTDNRKYHVDFVALSTVYKLIF